MQLIIERFAALRSNAKDWVRQAEAVPTDGADPKLEPAAAAGLIDAERERICAAIDDLPAEYDAVQVDQVVVNMVGKHRSARWTVLGVETGLVTK